MLAKWNQFSKRDSFPSFQSLDLRTKKVTWKEMDLDLEGSRGGRNVSFPGVFWVVNFSCVIPSHGELAFINLGVSSIFFGLAGRFPQRTE